MNQRLCLGLDLFARSADLTIQYSNNTKLINLKLFYALIASAKLIGTTLVQKVWILNLSCNTANALAVSKSIRRFIRYSAKTNRIAALNYVRLVYLITSVRYKMKLFLWLLISLRNTLCARNLLGLITKCTPNKRKNGNPTSYSTENSWRHLNSSKKILKVKITQPSWGKC